MRHQLPEARAGAVQIEQTRLLYARLPFSITFNFLLALILASSQSDLIAPTRVLAWLGILGTTLLFRTVLAVTWRRSGAATGECAPYWIRRFRIGATATGIAWGCGAAMLFPANDPLHEVLLSFVLAGLSAGAITSLAVDRASTLGFLVPTLVPLIGLFVIEGAAHTTAMAAMTALFLIFIASNAVYAGRALLENFQLRIKALEREDILRKNEARLNQAQHSAHIGNWELDLINNRLHWSDEIFRIFEIDQTKFEASHEGFLNAIHPDDRDKANQAYTDSLAKRAPYDIVHRLRFADGRIKFVREHCETDFDAAGKPLRSLGTVQDITQQQLAENTLRESEARYRAVTHTASDAIITADRAERIVGWNRGAETIFGYTEGEITGQHVTVLMPQRYRAQHLAAVARMLAGGKPRIAGSGAIELAGLRKDGSEFPLEMSLAQWESAAGKFFTGIIRDISERKKDELALRESEARFRFMLENSPIAARITRGSTTEVVFANRRYADIFNFEPDKIPVFDPKQYYAKPQDYADTMERLNKGEQVTNKLIELLIPSAFSKTTWTLASYMRLEYQNEPAVLGWFYDISDRKVMEEQVQHLAHYDQLTGLPNRTLFYDRLQQALASAKRDKTQLALMFIDLDKFKPINDTLGHDVGDLLLREVAQRIQGCLRESDTVARLGGDEFVALLPTVNSELDAVQVAEMIRYLLNQPFELAGHTMSISSSTGIAIYPEHGASEKLLIKNADAAMYYAKSVGRNNVQIYRADMQETSS